MHSYNCQVFFTSIAWLTMVKKSLTEKCNCHLSSLIEWDFTHEKYCYYESWKTAGKFLLFHTWLGCVAISTDNVSSNDNTTNSFLFLDARERCSCGSFWMIFRDISEMTEFSPRWHNFSKMPIYLKYHQILSRLHNISTRVPRKHKNF